MIFCTWNKDFQVLSVQILLGPLFLISLTHVLFFILSFFFLSFTYSLQDEQVHTKEWQSVFTCRTGFLKLKIDLRISLAIYPFREALAVAEKNKWFHQKKSPQEMLFLSGSSACHAEKMLA